MRAVPTFARFIANVGLRIAEARGTAGLTQEQLAEFVGVTPRHIQRIEAGRVDISISLLASIALAFGVEPAALLTKPEAARRRRPGRRPRV